MRVITHSVKELQMNQAAFDIVAHGLSRRASLATLGAAGLAALAQPVATEAKKKKKAKNPCAKQTQQCIDVATPTCSGDPDCEAAVEQCCQIAGVCEPLNFLVCFEGI